MNWIAACDRDQTLLLPPCLEDYVSPDNPVRFLDAFVEQLDLPALGFSFPKQNPQERGRPAYHPGVLLKLYIYGYLNRIRSSRRLEQECARNLELLWLLGGLKPDFKTIADFRKNNAGPFRQVLQQFHEICRKLQLFGGELLAIDGTKVKGCNSPAKNWSVTKLNKRCQELDERLQEYLQALDQADQQGGAGPGALTAAQLQDKIQQLKERKAGVEQKLQTLNQLGQTQLSATDPDTRAMKGAKGYVVGYNVQGAVDAKHHLLAHTSLTNSVSDQGQLAVVAQAAKEQLQIQRADIVADSGYYVTQNVKQCQDMGLEVHMQEAKSSPSERAGLFGKIDFKYDAGRDCYQCPAGFELKKRRESVDQGRRLFHYDNPKACAECPLKNRCTQSEFRTVGRWEHEASIERMRSVVAAHPRKLQQRKSLIEHCWATFKWLMPEGFLLKGIKKAAAEVSLVHLAYNFKRALKVVGLAKLLEALSPKTDLPGPKPRGSAETKPGQAAGSSPAQECWIAWVARALLFDEYFKNEGVWTRGAERLRSTPHYFSHTLFTRQVPK